MCLFVTRINPIIMIILLFLVWMLNPTAAHSAIDHDMGTLPIVIVKKRLNQRWSIYGEHTMFNNQGFKGNTSLIRPAVVYDINDHWSAWLGYNHLDFLDSDNDSENWVWEQVEYNTRIRLFKLANRFRFEQRFLPGISEPSLRMRERVEVQIPLDDAETWHFVTSDELLVNINHTPEPSVLLGGVTQNRVFVGVNKQLNSAMNLEVGYLAFYTNLPQPTNDSLRHFIQATLSFSF